MMRAATRWDASRWRNGGRAVLLLCAVAALSFQSGGSPAAAPIAVAVADFDYFDTSGEVTDQSAEHLAGCVHRRRPSRRGEAGRLWRHPQDEHAGAMGRDPAARSRSREIVDAANGDVPRRQRCRLSPCREFRRRSAEGNDAEAVTYPVGWVSLTAS